VFLLLVGIAGRNQSNSDEERLKTCALTQAGIIKVKESMQVWALSQ
jgi:hypothetical protein